MARPAVQTLGKVQSKSHAMAREVLIAVGASLFVALCARLTVPLPFTPVPLTLGNFGVLLVGLMLGSRRGFAALALYLAEGAAGLPVFTPGPGGIVQLLGPTGGYLLSYPFAAGLAGFVAESGRRTFARLVAGGVLAELAIFAGGVSWLMALTHAPLVQAAHFGLYPFVFAEIIKVMAAAGAASRMRRQRRA